MVKIQKILHRTKYLHAMRQKMATYTKEVSYSIPCMLVYKISLVTLNNQILTKHKYGFTAVFTPDFFLR